MDSFNMNAASPKAWIKMCKLQFIYLVVMLLTKEPL